MRKSNIVIGLNHTPFGRVRVEDPLMKSNEELLLNVQPVPTLEAAIDQWLAHSNVKRLVTYKAHKPLGLSCGGRPESKPSVSSPRMSGTPSTTLCRSC